jgi:hypothetical protein
MPPKTAGGSGYERTTVRQFTIFLESRVGKLMKLLNALADAGLRVNALAVEESADAALVRMIVSNTDDCRKCLREEQFSFTETDVLAVEVPRADRHPLISVCTALLGAEINIHHAYPLLRSREAAAIALYVDDPTLAARVLMRRDFKILGESDLT